MAAKTKACRCPAPKRSRRTAAQERLYEIARERAAKEEQRKMVDAGPCPMCGKSMPPGPEFGAPFAHSVKCSHCGWEGIRIG